MKQRNRWKEPELTSRASQKQHTKSHQCTSAPWHQTHTLPKGKKKWKIILSTGCNTSTDKETELGNKNMWMSENTHILPALNLLQGQKQSRSTRLKETKQNQKVCMCRKMPLFHLLANSWASSLNPAEELGRSDHHSSQRDRFSCLKSSSRIKVLRNNTQEHVKQLRKSTGLIYWYTEIDRAY